MSKAPEMVLYRTCKRMTERGTVDRIEAEGFSSPVLEVACKYKTMARFGDTVLIQARISDYNGVRLSLHYEVRDAQIEELRCEGESRHCFMGREGRPVSLKRSWPALDQALSEQLPQD